MGTQHLEVDSFASFEDASLEDASAAPDDKTTALDEVALATPRREEPGPLPTVCSARLVKVGPLDVTIAWRGSEEPQRALVASEVDRELLLEAFAAHTSVLVERAGNEVPIVIGLLQTRRPREVLVSGERIEIRADREILLRTGRAALRLRDDGEIELVGTRVSAVSRGLFRLVGRMLRLN